MEKKPDLTDPTQNSFHIENGNVAMKEAQAKYAAWMKRPLKERVELFEKPIKASLERVVSVSFNEDGCRLDLRVRRRDDSRDADMLTKSDRAFVAECNLTKLEYSTLDLVLTPLESICGRAFGVGVVTVEAAS